MEKKIEWSSVYFKLKDYYVFFVWFQQRILLISKKLQKFNISFSFNFKTIYILKEY